MSTNEISDHWPWVDDLLNALADDNGGITVGRCTAEYLYRTALEHGVKHGIEIERNRQRDGCDCTQVEVHLPPHDENEQSNICHKCGSVGLNGDFYSSSFMGKRRRRDSDRIYICAECQENGNDPPPDGDGCIDHELEPDGKQCDYCGQISTQCEYKPNGRWCCKECEGLLTNCCHLCGDERVAGEWDNSTFYCWKCLEEWKSEI